MSFVKDWIACARQSQRGLWATGGGPTHFQGAQILKSVMGNVLLPQLTKHEPGMNNSL